MKPEEQRVAIGQVVGWTIEPDKNGGFNLYEPRHRFRGWSRDRERLIVWLPDYLNDLNAMSEAIKILKDDKPYSSNPADYPTWMFLSNLSNVAGIKLFYNGEFVGSQGDLFKLANATAPQKCEALLKTLKLWKD